LVFFRAAFFPLYSWLISLLLSPLLTPYPVHVSTSLENACLLPVICLRPFSPLSKLHCGDGQGMKQAWGLGIYAGFLLESQKYTTKKT
jgi:hypothetical protein